MNIDTAAIRRLRDGLLSEGQQPASLSNAAGVSAEVSRAVVNRVEPFAETMYLVMMVDGEPAGPERAALAAALGLLTDGLVPAAELEALLERVAGRAAREGVEGRIAALGARLNGDRDDRETAFTLAAAIALADERVDVREHHVLAWIREYYGISERRSVTLLEAAQG